jgi:hypothetical protein
MSSELLESFTTMFDVAYATSNMVVKLSSSSLLILGVHDTYFDNVEIEATCAP